MPVIGRWTFPHIKNPLQRAYLEALAITGLRNRAAKAVGIHSNNVYRPDWKNDPEFQEALQQAEEIGAHNLEAESHRRAVEGMLVYKFDKYGRPLRNPEVCECEHNLREHRRPTPAEFAAIAAEEALRRSGKDAVPPDPRRPCEALGCTCTAFFGAPYYEHAYSDRLLEQMLAAKLKQYRKQVDVRSTNTNIDVTGLHDEIVGRIAAGEDREVVIASYIAKHTQQPIALLPKPNGQPDVG